MFNCSHSQPASINLGYTLGWGVGRKKKALFSERQPIKTSFKERLHVWGDTLFPQEALPSFNEGRVAQARRAGKKIKQNYDSLVNTSLILAF